MIFLTFQYITDMVTSTWTEPLRLCCDLSGYRESPNFHLP